MENIKLTKRAEDIVRILKQFEKTNIKNLTPERIKMATSSDKKAPLDKIIKELTECNLLDKSLELTEKGKEYSQSL